MDAIDVRILRAMGTRPSQRAPKPLDALQPARVARLTGLAVNTVKERIARLTDDGIIAGYVAFPNLQHLQLNAAALYIEFPDNAAKDAAVRELRSFDGLLELADFLGRGLCADLAFRDARDRAEKMARLRACADDQGVMEFYAWEAPPVPRALTPLDWRIVQALRADPRAGAADLAPAVGVSSRTVKRHLARMAAEGSVFLAPVLDPSKAEGLFIFAILVYLADGSGPRPINALRAEFDGELVYDFVPTSAELGQFDMLLFARTTSEVETMRRRAEAVPGVLRAEAWLFRSFDGIGPWLDGAIMDAAERA